MKNRFNEEIEIQTENGEFQPIALVNKILTKYETKD